MSEYSFGEKVVIIDASHARYCEPAEIVSIGSMSVKIQFDDGQEIIMAHEMIQLASVAGEAKPPEAVSHPAHYGGDTTYEVIKVAEAWGLDKDAYLFNLLKYIGRNGKKAGNPTLQDLRKGSFYLDRRIRQLEAGE